MRNIAYLTNLAKKIRLTKCLGHAVDASSLSDLTGDITAQALCCSKNKHFQAGIDEF